MLEFAFKKSKKKQNMFWKLWFIYDFTICSLSISIQKWQYCLDFIINKYLQSHIKVALQASR